jgi:hypothetical protein
MIESENSVGGDDLGSQGEGRGFPGETGPTADASVKACFGGQALRRAISSARRGSDVSADHHCAPSIPRLKACCTSETLPHRFSGSFSRHPRMMDSNQSGTDGLINLGGAAKIFECWNL